MSELPRKWVAADIGSLTNYVSRGKSPKYVPSSDLPVVNQKCVRWTGVDERHVKFVDPATWASWGEERFLQVGDILWNSTGTGTIGRAALFAGLPSYSRAVVDSHVTILRVNQAVQSEYLFGFIQSPAVQDLIEDMQSGSTNQVELNRSEVVSTEVPLPPLAEQRRIVAKLDALTARTARAREDLDRIPALAARYKQAVLAELFSPTRLSARAVPFFEVLNIKGGSQPPKSTFISEAAEGYVRLLQIRDFGSDAKAVFIRDEARWPKCAADDIMVGRYGASVGKVLSGKAGAYNVALVKIIFDREVVDRDFLFLWLQSATFQQALNAVSRSAQDGFNKGDLEAIRFPLLPLEQQRAEASRAIKALGEIDRLTTEAAAARRLLNRMDQSVMTKAFRGELVPQDPDDEPAMALLDRIRAERAATPKTKRGRKVAA